MKVLLRRSPYNVVRLLQANPKSTPCTYLWIDVPARNVIGGEFFPNP